MAFTQKSKFTSSGLMNRMPNKAKLINNSKTAFQQNVPEGFVATKSETFEGKQVPTYGYVEETKSFEGDQGLSYQTVYDNLPTDADGNKVNDKTGAVYTDVSQFEDDAKDSRTSKVYYEGDVDVVSGTPSETIRSVEYPQGLYDMGLRYKKANDSEGWKRYLAKNNIELNDDLRNYLSGIREIREERKVRDQERKDFKRKLEFCNNTNNVDESCQEVQAQAERNRKYNQKRKQKKYTRQGTQQSETYTGLRKVN